jgi:acyl-coenzyme A synthetase/AMP-(fatty) acid ligase
MHIVDMVYFWAQTMPQQPAVIQPEGVVTYRALVQGIERAATYFAQNIPDNSKPVIVSLESGPKMLIASLGLLRVGFDIIVAGKNELAHISPDDSNMLVCDRSETTLGDRTHIVFEESWLRTGAGASQPSRPLSQPRTRNADVFFFTSGTTGRPKRIIRTQRAWEQQILFNSTSAFANYERVLLVPSLNNSMGLGRAYSALYDHKTICFAPVGQPMLWLANIYDVDMIVGSPQQVLSLAEIQEKVTRYPLSALKGILLGGSRLSADGIQRIKHYLCRNVILYYGSTEAGAAAIAPHDMIAHIPNAVGFVAPGAEIQIVDAQDNAVPAGSEGFVRLRTRQFLLNFQIEDSSTWYYPGDVGWLTEDGVLCIAGRKGDVINRGGVKLSVNDFEDFLRSCPGVKDAGVCTLMGASGFEEIWIGVVLDPLADIGALRQKIEANTNFGTNIDKLFVVAQIPRGALGKIQHDELKKMLQSIAEEGNSGS